MLAPRIDEWGEYHSPNVCFQGGGGSSPSGTTTTTQTSSPWAGQVPFLQGTGPGNSGPYGSATLGQFFSNPSGTTLPGTNGMTINPNAPSFGTLPTASAIYSQVTPQYYPGTTYAPETSAQAASIAGQEQLGLAPNQVGNAATGASSNILSNGFLTSNPGNAAYEDILNGGANVKSAIANATPGLLDTFTQGNRLGSPSAAYGVGQGIGNAVAGLELQAGQGLSQNYGQAAGQQNTATLLAPQTEMLGFNPLEQAYSAGATQQGLNQNVINDAIARYNYNQTLPFNLYDWYAGAVNGGNYGGTSTLTSPYFTQNSGGAGGALGGAMTGASVGSLFGPWGTALGLIGGGIAGGLG